MTPKCPEHPDVALEPKKKGWYCEECDSSVLSYDQVSEGGVVSRGWTEQALRAVML